MPAYFDKGFVVRQPAWHGLALVLDDYPGRDEAIKLAGHNFTVLERPVWDVDTASNVANEIPGWKGLFRSDTNALLSVARSTYEVVQNSVLWDLVDSLVAQPNMKYETAGVLKDGTVVWVLARLDEPLHVPGDNSPVYQFVRASTTHDGSGALKAISTSVRTVCWNTFSAGDAESERSGLTFTFRHSKNVKDRIEDAKAILGLTRENLSSFSTLALELANHSVNSTAVHEFVRAFIPEPPAALESSRVRSNIDNARDAIYKILEGPTVPDNHKHTSYGLFCAGIEYLDHVRAFRSPETYFNRSFTHDGGLKTRLAKLALAVAAS